MKKKTNKMKTESNITKTNLKISNFISQLLLHILAIFVVGVFLEDKYSFIAITVLIVLRAIFKTIEVGNQIEAEIDKEIEEEKSIKQLKNKEDDKTNTEKTK